MPEPLAAAVSHVGRIRSDNQDSGYAGAHLFVVADGMGGHAGGDVASALAIRGIKSADHEYENVADAQVALTSAIVDANDGLQAAMREHPELSGMGTTVSGIIRVGNKVAIAHIGDSRIYRYRVGALSQITTDHTFVQKLVEAGRITKDEAETHPRRNVVMRVLGNIETHPEIDELVEDALPGDRWLLCSDGLSSYVSEDRIAALLGRGSNAAATAQRLVAESLSHGAPDNVTVVVMDVDDSPVSSVEPKTVGSAAAPISYEAIEPERAPIKLSQLILHPLQSRLQPEFEHFEPESEEYLQELVAEQQRYRRRRRLSWSIGAALAVIALIVGGLIFYNWTQNLYYVGANDDGFVTIYQGVQQDIGPIQLSSEVDVTTIDVDDLSSFNQQMVEQTINAESLEDAQQIVDRLEPAP